MRIETAKLVDKKYLTVLILVGHCDNRPCKNKASIVANLDGDVWQFCNDCFNLLQQLRDQKRAEHHMHPTSGESTVSAALPTSE